MIKNVNPMTVPLGACISLLERAVALDFGNFLIQQRGEKTFVFIWNGEQWDFETDFGITENSVLSAFGYIEKRMKSKKQSNG